jgi:hypothetical protein
MAATSWQHIRPFSGDVQHTLQQLRRDVFASNMFYLAEVPSVGAAMPVGATLTRSRRPATIGRALRWNGVEGTHSVLDITDGVAGSPRPSTVSALEPEALQRCFGSTRPTLFEVLMTDFDAADVCEDGTGRYFVVADPGEPALVVFVGRTGT